MLYYQEKPITKTEYLCHLTKHPCHQPGVTGHDCSHIFALLYVIIYKYEK